MIRRFLTMACLLGCALLAGQAPADVEMLQLREADLADRIPNWRRLGLLPGDVLLENEHVQAVVLATPRDGEPRAGRCVVLDKTRRGNPEPTTIQPGPRGVWQKAEAGKTSTVAIVRFRHFDSQFEAELVFRLHDGGNWLDVSTTLRNPSQDRVLEMPLVDEVLTVGKVRVSNDKDGVQITHKSNGATVALLPLSQQARTSQFSDDRHLVSYVSGDAEPARSRFAFIGIGKRAPKTNMPVGGERGWDRGAKDKSNWFRIPAGGERTVARRILSAPSPTETRAVAKSAERERTPVVRITPSDTAPPEAPALQSQSTAPSPNTSNAAATETPATAGRPSANTTITRKIIGQLRPNAPTPTMPLTTSGGQGGVSRSPRATSKAATRTRSAKAPSAPSAPAQLPGDLSHPVAPPVRPAIQATKPAPPPELPPAINDIRNLAPPEE